MSRCIAVINAGSSSIKFALYQLGSEALLYRGKIEQIGISPHLQVDDANGVIVAERRWPGEDFDHAAATHAILTTGRSLLADSPVAAVGHRVVHGGTKYAQPTRIDRNVIADLSELIPLAPLHQPHNLAPIRTIAEAAPDLPQVACFDTAFHRSQPHIAQLFALPQKLTEAGVRRYGFHGLSYEYVSSYLGQIAPELAEKHIIVAHLGNGASLCAIHRGRSVATTMGFTAVDGLVMGTRCGALDPGVILYLMQSEGMDAQGIEDLIYRNSGLFGVSGISSDMRELRASPAPEAAEAIALFVYRIVREIGSLAAALGGLDALIFTGGIGENDSATRAEIVHGCAWMGLRLDPARNSNGVGCISADTSQIPVWVIPTDEERMIARQTRALLGL
jgi:acetate kinase